MRKLMAWMLTIVMVCLPLTTLAESRAIDLHFTSVDTAVYLNTFQEVLFGEEDEAFLSLVRKGGELAAEFIKASTIRLQWQEDGCRLSWLLDEKEAASAALMATENGLVLSSSLIPGYGLTMPYTTTDVSELAQVDWEDLAEDLLEECFDWSASIASQEVTGSFSGDAYAGGTKATYVTITDQDVALLLDGLLLCLEDEDDLMTWLESSQGESSSQLMHEARRSILNAGLSSTYSYQLTIMEDDTSVIGMDWATYQGDSLVWTLSVGSSDTADTAVLTVPLNDSNGYLALQMNETGIIFTAYQCETGVSYQEAAQTNRWKTFSACWTGDVTEGDDSYTGSLSQSIASSFEEGTASLVLDTNLSGRAAKDFSAGEFTLTGKINGTKVVSVVATLQSAEPFTQEEGLTLVDVTAATDREWAQIADALEQGEEDTLISLFKLLPTKLLRKLVEFQQELTNLTEPINDTQSE
ncbi:MAG: hypothetical protein Q4B32_00240 [Clostridia bacterium]|nr:hypothetical protein [Clostridia bacterium]